MRYRIWLFAILWLAAGCATTQDLSFQVTPAGEEAPESIRSYRYTLPQTVLQVKMVYVERQFIPGPYWEYAERFLGITDVVGQRSSQWNISDVQVTALREPDPAHQYALHLLEGELTADVFRPYLENGLLWDRSGRVDAGFRGPGMEPPPAGELPLFSDRTIYSNFAERTETMYKTLVTDTSFVEVPVQRTVVEQKSVATKAGEAAEFILELRTRRFEMLTGEYEAYPAGEAMESAIRKLDELEREYLSLFTGKTFSRVRERSWFVIPRAGGAPSSQRLGVFSRQLGFVPAELMEGASLEIHFSPAPSSSGLPVIPSGEEVSYSMPGKTGGRQPNLLYYRIPAVTDLTVLHGEEVLFRKHVSVFQAGPVESTPVR